MKRVAADLDELDNKKARDKFGNQFVYQMSQRWMKYQSICFIDEQLTMVSDVSRMNDIYHRLLLVCHCSNFCVLCWIWNLRNAFGRKGLRWMTEKPPSIVILIMDAYNSGNSPPFFYAELFFFIFVFCYELYYTSNYIHRYHLPGATHIEV